MGTKKLKYDGRRWIPDDTDLPVFQRQERIIERREGDHFISGILVGLAGGGVLTTVVIALAEVLRAST